MKNIIGERKKWRRGSLRQHHVMRLMRRTRAQKTDKNCGDVNERCAAIGGTLIPVGTKNFFSTTSSRSNWPFAPSLLELLGVATTD